MLYTVLKKGGFRVKIKFKLNILSKNLNIQSMIQHLSSIHLHKDIHTVNVQIRKNVQIYVCMYIYIQNIYTYIIIIPHHLSSEPWAKSTVLLKTCISLSLQMYFNFLSIKRTAIKALTCAEHCTNLKTEVHIYMHENYFFIEMVFSTYRNIQNTISFSL